MEMIAMGDVVLRSRRDIEAGAGALMYQVQEACFGSLFQPIMQNTDAPPGAQAKTDDIEGIGRGMLAAALTARDAAAGGAAHKLDLHHKPAGHPPGRRLQG